MGWIKKKKPWSELTWEEVLEQEKGWINKKPTKITKKHPWRMIKNEFRRKERTER